MATKLDVGCRKTSWSVGRKLYPADVRQQHTKRLAWILRLDTSEIIVFVVGSVRFPCWLKTLKTRLDIMMGEDVDRRMLHLTIR